MMGTPFCSPFEGHGLVYSETTGDPSPPTAGEHGAHVDQHCQAAV